MPMWMVRAGSGGEKVNDFQKHGMVGFGDERLGKLPIPISKQALLLRVPAHADHRFRSKPIAERIAR